MKFYIYQYRIGRRFFGGTFFKIHPVGLCMGDFWSINPIKSCQSICIDIEQWPSLFKI